jgi:hypothetical protein
MPHSCGTHIALQLGAIRVLVAWLATLVAHNVAFDVVPPVTTCVCGWFVHIITPLGVIIGVYA